MRWGWCQGMVLARSCRRSEERSVWELVGEERTGLTLDVRLTESGRNNSSFEHRQQEERVVVDS